MKALDPIEGGCRVRKFPCAVIELALAASDATEVEPQCREAALLEHVEELVDDLVVHRAAELWMRMQDDGDRRAFFLGRLVAAFQSTCWAVEDDFGHWYSGHVFWSGTERQVRLDEAGQLF